MVFTGDFNCDGNSDTIKKLAQVPGQAAGTARNECCCELAGVRAGRRTLMSLRCKGGSGREGGGGGVKMSATSSEMGKGTSTCAALRPQTTPSVVLTTSSVIGA